MRESYVAWNGATISLEDHETLHAQWINERHSFGHFDLTPLNASPERVRARFAAIPSGVPTASTWPPASPPSGPESTCQEQNVLGITDSGRLTSGAI